MKDGDHHEEVVFSKDVNPIGILQCLAKKDLVHTEENEVQYFKSSIDEEGKRRQGKQAQNEACTEGNSITELQDSTVTEEPKMRRLKRKIGFSEEDGEEDEEEDAVMMKRAREVQITFFKNKNVAVAREGRLENTSSRGKERSDKETYSQDIDEQALFFPWSIPRAIEQASDSINPTVKTRLRMRMELNKRSIPTTSSARYYGPVHQRALGFPDKPYLPAHVWLRFCWLQSWREKMTLFGSSSSIN
ncbi:hypothetical protein EDD85DRAFT_790271 [Armillaria nabsnona]|nr:hypothetical protein EDD85DRAFT_790271 [Armillaria nabsnona]